MALPKGTTHAGRTPGRRRRVALIVAKRAGKRIGLDTATRMLLATAVEAACLCIVGGIAAGGGPIDRGVDSIPRWPQRIFRSWARLKARRLPRLKHVAAGMMAVVTVYPVLSDGGARKADRETDPSDKAFDHGSIFPIAA